MHVFPYLPILSRIWFYFFSTRTFEVDRKWVEIWLNRYVTFKQSATIKLNSGHDMPIMALGTWLHKYDFENQMADAVVYAINKGYKHIDCAYIEGFSMSIFRLTNFCCSRVNPL